ncbi:MAG TPA: hypothetical protein VIL09_13875 [Microvirga sp.]|jgi:hypothetical protein
MIEMYHIELLEPSAEGGRVLRRTSVRSASVEPVKDRARRLFQRSRAPGSRTAEVEGVRVLNGAGHEVFSLNVND